MKRILYRRIGRRFASHEAVNHSARGIRSRRRAREHGRRLFLDLQARHEGVYQHCDERHLHRYLCEFDFRYSNRVKLGVDDTERTRRAIVGAEGKRLTYRRNS